MDLRQMEYCGSQVKRAQGQYCGNAARSSEIKERSTYCMYQ